MRCSAAPPRELIADSAWEILSVRIGRTEVRPYDFSRIRIFAIVSEMHLVRTIGQRSVRDDAHACARKVSWLTPAAPCAWMARSSTPQRHVRRHDLDHRDLGARGLVAHRIHQVRRPQRQQPRLIDLDARLRDVAANGALLRERLAERHPRR